jgi:hypothetical protein
MSSARCCGSGAETTSANVLRNPFASVSGNFVWSNKIRSGGRIATGSPSKGKRPTASFFYEPKHSSPTGLEPAIKQRGAEQGVEAPRPFFPPRPHAEGWSAGMLTTRLRLPSGRAARNPSRNASPSPRWLFGPASPQPLTLPKKSGRSSRFRLLRLLASCRPSAPWSPPACTANSRTRRFPAARRDAESS